MTLLATPAVQAGTISITDSAATPWAVNGANGGDVAYNASETFTVTAAPTNSVLVIELTQDCASNVLTSADLNPTLTWYNGSTTQTINTTSNLAEREVSANSTYIATFIFYLWDPNQGTGQVTISGTGREAEMSAFTLSGVQTPLPSRLRKPGTSEYGCRELDRHAGRQISAAIDSGSRLNTAPRPHLRTPRLSAQIQQ